MFESPNVPDRRDPSLERREALKDGMGLVLCTKRKDESVVPLAEQIAIVEAMKPAAIQFDFRNRSIDEIRGSREALLALRSRNALMSISIHGDNPKVDESTLGIKNAERIVEELHLLQDIGGETYTIHPPGVSAETFAKVSEEVRAVVIKNYADTYAHAIADANEKGIEFGIAIENMPAKGDSGSWGQRVDDVIVLIDAVERAAVERGIERSVVHKYVGATFDVNHALHDADSKDYDSLLKGWFESLGSRLKVVHLYTPAEANADFDRKREATLRYVSLCNPGARIFMESKQDIETTRRLYDAARV